MSWKNAAKNVQWTEDTEKATYPRIRWNNGRRVGRVGEPGQFYVKAQYMNGCPVGWAESQLYPNEEGYEAADIAIIPIARRTQPFTMVDGVMTWHKQYERDKGMKLYTEIVCFLRGYDEPVIFACKGWIAGRITAVKRSVFQEHNDLVVKVANAQAEAALPQWAFWVEFGGAYDKQGKPVFIEVGSGSQKAALHDVVWLGGITQPANDKQIEALYIGDELFNKAAVLRAELVNSGWLEERRGNTQAEEIAAATPKIAPQSEVPYDEESIF
jgi:hypothetical protein